MPMLVWVTVNIFTMTPFSLAKTTKWSKSLDDQYSIADVKSCIDTVGQDGSKVFSTLDLTTAFWQLPLHPNGRKNS